VTAPTLSTGPTTTRMWERSADTFEAILAHPFLTELASGELDRQRFAYYVAQDAHYLRGYAKALSLLAGRAGDEDTTAMFAGHAANAVAVEQSMHAAALTEMGLDPKRPPEPAPSTVAYCSYLLATTHTGSFLEAVSAVLPCYWIYWEVGRALGEHSCPDPLYADWIATYGGAEFEAVVRPVLRLTDRIGADASPAERAEAGERYAMAARYEWMFWDAAYRLESWPL